MMGTGPRPPFWRKWSILRAIAIIALSIHSCESFSHLFAQSPSNKKGNDYPSSARDASGISSVDRVLVTGAAGKTGRLVLKKLLDDSRYNVKALVRSEKSALDLVKDPDINCPLESIVISDVTSPTFREDLPACLKPSDAKEWDSMVICTSAVPKISKASLAKATLKVPLNLLRGKKPVDYRTLRFKWKNDGYPEKVDYHGQINQVDLAKSLGMTQVVLVSSMGGTRSDNFLNSVGKRSDGSGHGDILLWKRKAEAYLVRQEALDYAIIHPGGLVDAPAGKEQVVLGVDDDLQHAYSRTRISREDVADLCVAALNVAKGSKVSFDCIADETRYPSENVESKLLSFLEEARTASYSI